LLKQLKSLSKVKSEKLLKKIQKRLAIQFRRALISDSLNISEKKEKEKFSYFPFLAQKHK
jgi:hypothetical protein